MFGAIVQKIKPPQPVWIIRAFDEEKERGEKNK